MQDIQTEIQQEAKQPTALIGPAQEDISAQLAKLAEQLDTDIVKKVVSKVQRLTACNKQQADFDQIRGWCEKQRDAARKKSNGPQLSPLQWAAFMFEFKTFESYATRFFKDFDGN